MDITVYHDILRGVGEDSKLIYLLNNQENKIVNFWFDWLIDMVVKL